MRAALAALGVAVAVAGGCGDEPDRRLSREEFIRRADEICAEYEQRLAALPEPESLEDVAPLARRAFPIAQEGIARLRELDPPPELAGRVRAWLRRNDANARSIHRLEEAAERGNARRVQEIASEAADNERRADELAREIGLDECARER